MRKAKLTFVTSWLRPRCNRNCSGAFVLWRSARRGAAERSHARPWHGAEGSELLCAKPAASSGEGGGDRRAAGIGVGVGGGAAAALAAGLDTAKEDGVAALLWLKAIMEATVRQSPSIPLPDLLVEFARGLSVCYESLALGLYLDFARVLANSQDWRVQAFAF